MFSICVILLSFFSFWDSHTDSVDVFITNNLSSASISKMFYLVNGQLVLEAIPMPVPLSPDSTILITLPALYLNRIIFECEDKSVFRESQYPASLSGDTITVSLSNKEYGFIFDRVFGSYLLALRNSSTVPIVSVRIPGDSVLGGNLLRGRVLLPSEYLFLWIDSGTVIEAFATDVNGNISSALTAAASSRDTVYQFTSSCFYDNGNVFGFEDGVPGSMVVNCLPDYEIVLVEAFDLDGYFVSGMDCSAMPLQTWDRVFCPHTAPLSYILCTDREGRTYSLIEPIHETGEYLIDLLSLDFGFGFPK